jgi:tripartite ATP-independent transporter DctP family solute receptor
MNTRRKFLGGLGAAAAISMVPASFANSTNVVLTATDVHIKDYPTVKAVEWLGQQFSAGTDGRYSFRQYHSGQLGRESEAIDMVRFGAIDLTRVYTGGLNNAFPLTRALCLPYVFDSVAHMRRAIDGKVGDEVLRGFEKRGLVGLAIYDSGARCFYNTRRAIREPKDMIGLKLRVPPSDIFMELIRQLGANPTPLAYGEVFSALQTHLIDGAENNVKSFHSSRQFEAARYWSQTEHSYAPDVLVISKIRFDSMQVADQQKLRQLAKESVTIMRELWDKTADESRKTLQQQGIQMNDINTNAFRKAAEPLVREYRKDAAIEQLYKNIRALA